MKLLLIPLFLALIVSGCASVGDKPYQQTAAPQNQAKVVVYGSIYNMLQDPLLYVNDEKIGRLNTKGFQVLYLPPGEHTFQVKQTKFGLPISTLEAPSGEKGTWASSGYKIASIPRIKLTLKSGEERFLKASSGKTGKVDDQTARNDAFMHSAYMVNFGFYLLEKPARIALAELEDKKEITN